MIKTSTVPDKTLTEPLVAIGCQPAQLGSTAPQAPGTSCPTHPRPHLNLNLRLRRRSRLNTYISSDKIVTSHGLERGGCFYYDSRIVFGKKESLIFFSPHLRLSLLSFSDSVVVFSYLRTISFV